MVETGDPHHEEFKQSFLFSNHEPFACEVLLMYERNHINDDTQFWMLDLVGDRIANYIQVCLFRDIHLFDPDNLRTHTNTLLELRDC